MGIRSRNGKSAAGKKDDDREQVGELHFGWVDGRKLGKKNGFRDCLEALR